MDFSVTRFETEVLSSNSYVILPLDENYSNEAIIIDAGGSFEKISEFLRENKRQKISLLLTHGHFDHIAAAADFKGLGAVVYLSGEDQKMVESGGDLARYFGIKLKPQSADNGLIGGLLQISGLKIEVMETAGHTAGGRCFKIENALFTGDTLFKGGFGRIDFPTGNVSDLIASVKRLFELPEETVVYPGHGEQTTIGEEKQSNPIKNLKAWQ